MSKVQGLVQSACYHACVEAAAPRPPFISFVSCVSTLCMGINSFLMHLFENCLDFLYGNKPVVVCRFTVVSML